MLGTDATLEDFYGFSGREPDWNFKFLGWKDVLCVMDPKDNYQHSYGPDGDIPDEQWSVRKMAVVVRTPKNPRHPFSAVINFLDAEDWYSSYHFNFDRKGKLWKIMQWQWRYSEDYTLWQGMNKGIRAMSWQHGYITDVQNNRATLFFCSRAADIQLDCYARRRPVRHQQARSGPPLRADAKSGSLRLASDDLKDSNAAGRPV